MGRVRGYRTRKGKRVKAYTRSSTGSLGFLRHSRPKSSRRGAPFTPPPFSNAIRTPGGQGYLHTKRRLRRDKATPVEVTKLGGGLEGLEYLVQEMRRTRSSRGLLSAGGRYHRVTHNSGRFTRYRKGN